MDWHYQEEAAYDAVCHLRAVKGVTNRIAGRPASLGNEVKAHIEAALRRRFGKKVDRIEIETRGDHVILRGTVTSFSERAEVEQAAWTTPGVCHVNNNLAVEHLTKPVNGTSDNWSVKGTAGIASWSASPHSRS